MLLSDELTEAFQDGLMKLEKLDLRELLMTPKTKENL